MPAAGRRGKRAGSGPPSRLSRRLSCCCRGEQCGICRPESAALCARSLAGWGKDGVGVGRVRGEGQRRRGWGGGAGARAGPGLTLPLCPRRMASARRC